jgi:hypothetical protein
MSCIVRSMTTATLTGQSEYMVTFVAKMATGPYGTQAVTRRFSAVVEAANEKKAVASARAKVSDLYGDRVYRLVSATKQSWAA